MFYIYFLILLSLNLLSNTQISPFNTIVCFGDDNTDTGNVYNLTNHQWPPVPPYYSGRFSNGPLWIEKLGVSKIINYAYIGATLDNDNLIDDSIPINNTIVPGLRQQILKYLKVNDLSTVDLSHTLYIIWGGNNDYLANSSLPSDLIVTSLISAIYDLVLEGIKNLLVINQSPLQYYPIYHELNPNENFITQMINHNNYLLSNVTQIKNLYSTSVKIFDLYSLITNLISNNSINKSNTNDKCWNILNNKLLSNCSNPNEYIFLDDYHFTTSIHEIIAKNIRQFISSSNSSHLSYLSKFYIFIFIIEFIYKIIF